MTLSKCTIRSFVYATAALFFASSDERLIAGAAPDAAKEYSGAQCNQSDTAWLAIRACTFLLDHSEIDRTTRVRFYVSRGRAWLREEEPKEALADFTRALELDSTDLQALTGRARANTALGDHAAAASDWTLVIERAGASYPGPSGLSEPIDKMYLERGAAWLAAGNADAALADSAKALEINPKSSKAHLARAAAYSSANDRRKAAEEFELAIKAAPADLAPYMARAEAAERWGDQSLAVDSYLGAIKINPRGAWHARKALQRLGVAPPP